MNIRNTVPVFAAVLALGTSAAFATSMTLTGDYSVSETYSSSHCSRSLKTNCDGPTITKDLSEPINVSLSLTPGMETIKNFIKTSPYGSCGGGGCDTTTHTETDSLSVLFSHLEVGSISATDLTDTGTFTAKYSGSELQCAMHDGVGASSSGQSDCLYWGSTTTFNGYDVLTDNLNDGYDLDIFLYNATDWDITSQIGFELVAAPSSVPEPATLALFAAGLAALGWTLSRRRKVS